MDFQDLVQEQHFKPCMMALLQGAPNLKALKLKSCAANCNDLRSLSSSSLKYLALQFAGAGWLDRLKDLNAVPNLESLKLWISWSPCAMLSDELDLTNMPDVRLTCMPKLRRIELVKKPLSDNGFPGDQLFMRLYVDNLDALWGDCLKRMLSRTTAMWLGQRKLQAWPSGLDGFVSLQLLDMEIDHYPCTPMLDLAHLPRTLAAHSTCQAAVDGLLAFGPYKRVLGEPRAHWFGWCLHGIQRLGCFCHPHQAFQLLWQEQ